MMKVKNKLTGEELDLTDVWESNVPGQFEMLDGWHTPVDDGILVVHSNMFVNGEEWLITKIGKDWLHLDKNGPVKINEECINCLHEDCADCGKEYKIHELY